MRTRASGTVERYPLARRAIAAAALCAALSAALTGCFPEDQLHAPGDAATDIPRSDIVAPKDAVADAGDIDAPPGLDVVIPDVPGDGGTRDVPMMPLDADLCGMVPAGPVPSMAIFGVPANPRDMAFDGRGGLAIAAGTAITLVQRGGSTSPVLPVAPGNVTALRYTASGQIVFATVSIGDGGAVTGGLYVLEPADGGFAAPTTRWSPTGRVDGIAVHPDGTVYFSDRTAGAIYRLSLGDTAAPESFATIAAPGPLAFDATGRTLYVGSARGVESVSLDPPADGGAREGTHLYGVSDTVSGIATDTCGNVWFSVSRGNPLTSQIYRLFPPSYPRVYESVDGVAALAFGQGGAFDDRVIYFLQPSISAVRAVGVVARGVARPAP